MPDEKSLHPSATERCKEQSVPHPPTRPSTTQTTRTLHTTPTSLGSTQKPQKSLHVTRSVCLGWARSHVAVEGVSCVAHIGEHRLERPAHGRRAGQHQLHILTRRPQMGRHNVARDEAHMPRPLVWWPLEHIHYLDVRVSLCDGVEVGAVDQLALGGCRIDQPDFDVSASPEDDFVDDLQHGGDARAAANQTPAQLARPFVSVWGWCGVRHEVE
mmetsp:Transcript_9230/g.26617  ORF Transcript_9230/g.26617 Transcript_9230/m.26617 type:complete len:214 (-) Transcript_9230:2183-2824(-)